MLGDFTLMGVGIATRSAAVWGAGTTHMMEPSLLLCTATDVESFQQDIPTKDEISLYNSFNARHLLFIVVQYSFFRHLILGVFASFWPSGLVEIFSILPQKKKE